MVVAIEAATFASLSATRTTLMPLVVKHCFANSIQIFIFAHISCAARYRKIFTVLRYRSLFRTSFFLGTLDWNGLWLLDDRRLSRHTLSHRNRRRSDFNLCDWRWHVPQLEIRRHQS